MMKFTSLLPKATDYRSVRWAKSETTNGVTFGIRRISLRKRIELTQRIKELSLQEEFLKAGDVPDQLQGSIQDLYVHRLLLEWGLAGLEGLTIDGEVASCQSLIEKGPENLANEIISAIRTEAGLSDDERKNS